MGLLDALGSLTIAAGEELPGITQRVDERAQRRVNAAIGQDFELARMDGDLPRMKSIMEGAGAGQYNEGSTAPGSELFGIMRQTITNFENDDDEKLRTRLKANAAMGGPTGRNATMELYKLNNPNATEEELQSVGTYWDQQEQLKTAQQRKQAGLTPEGETPDTSDWELVRDKETNQPLYWMDPKTQAIKEIKGGPGMPGADPGDGTPALTKRQEYLIQQVRIDPRFRTDASADLESEIIDAFAQLGEDIPVALTAAQQSKIAEFETSIAELDGLDKYLRDPEVQSKMGPLRGRWSQWTPWDTDAKEAIAKMKGIKQVIGKALEGGVLRKEDEEKYNAILPVETDTAEVALRKIQMLNNRLKKAKSIYERNIGAGMPHEEAAAGWDETESDTADAAVTEESVRDEIAQIQAKIDAQKGQ